MPTAAQNFAQMDANSDGQLTHEEMHAYKMQNSQNEIRQQFSAADRDSNKLIDQAEAASLPMLADQFAKVDVNSDGNVSMDEMQAYHHEMDQDWHDANKTTHDGTQPSQDADQSRSTTTTNVEQFDDDNWRVWRSADAFIGKHGRLRVDIVDGCDRWLDRLVGNYWQHGYGGHERHDGPVQHDWRDRSLQHDRRLTTGSLKLGVP